MTELQKVNGDLPVMIPKGETYTDLEYVEETDPATGTHMVMLK